MASLKQLYDRIKAVNTDTICIDSVKDTKDAITDLNTQQMFAGLRSDGSEITPSYTDYTIALKEEKGQITDHVTLNDTGAFYEAMKTEVQGIKVITDSTDEKSEKLKKKYSTRKGKIFGLSEKYKQEYINENLKPVFTKKIRAATGLKKK